MQGFNMGRYRPYDADPSKESFNARSGKHPLGDRARKLDQGILVVRFELPFNVWCDGCDNHIGQGVRYNAEKRKVGHYLSTPIFAFRCKCHLCSNWFEIRTDPQHTRYVVESGARKQNQEWDADANGSFSIELGDAGPSTLQAEAAKDPFAGVEKAENAKVQARTAAQRIAELEDLSERHSNDPYSLNAKLRKRHRKEKRETLRQGEADDAVRKRLGWRDDIGLARDDESLRADAASAWREAQHTRNAQHTEGPIDARQLIASKVSGSGRADGSKSHRLAPAPSDPPRSKSGTSTPSPAQLLASKLASSARKERDPFMKVMRDSLQRK